MYWTLVDISLHKQIKNSPKITHYWLLSAYSYTNFELVHFRPHHTHSVIRCGLLLHVADVLCKNWLNRSRCRWRAHVGPRNISSRDRPTARVNYGVRRTENHWEFCCSVCSQRDRSIVNNATAAADCNAPASSASHYIVPVKSPPFPCDTEFRQKFFDHLFYFVDCPISQKLTSTVASLSH